MDLIKRKQNRVLFFIFVLLIVSPYFKVFPHSAEVQPIYVLICITGFLLYRKVPVSFVGLAIYIFICFFYSFLPHNDAEPLRITETFLAIFSPIVLVFYLTARKVTFDDVRLPLIIITVFLSILGTLQAFFPALLDKSGINSLLSYVVSRYSGSSIGGESGRGIRLIASEPSYAAYSLIILYYYFISCFCLDKKRSSLVMCLCSIYLLLLTKSATAMVGMLIPLIILFLFKIKDIMINLRTLSLLVILLLVFYLLSDLPFVVNSRFYLAFTKIEDIVSDGGSIFNALSILDSGRVLSSLVGYSSVLTTFQPSFGSWSYDFSSRLDFFGFDISQIHFLSEVAVNVKPFSFVGTLLFDLGIWGIPIIVLIAYRISQVWLENYKIIGMPYLVTSFSAMFFILFSTPVSLSAFWFFLCLRFEKS